MPQGPIAVTNYPNPKLKTSLNITAPTVVKAGPGTILSVLVQVAGSAPGSVNDVATDAPAAANQVAVIPNALETMALNFPCLVGILIVPGAGQTLSVSFQ